MHSSNHKISRDIARLKRLYQMSLRETRPGKRRFAFYDYLYEVYAVHGQWRAGLKTPEIKEKIAAVSRAPLSSDQDPLKLIVDASCTSDYKTRIQLPSA